MKILKPNFPLIILLVFFTGCRPSVSVDAEINADIRQEIDSLNRVVIAALREQKTRTILKLAASDFLKDDSVRIKLRQISRGAKDLKLSEYQVEHQIFSDKLRADTLLTMTFKEGTEQEYTFGFEQHGKPTVASFIVIPEDRRELSLVTVFSKEHEGWKLTNLQIGIYRIEGRTAVDWDIRASQADRAGAIVDAMIAQTMAEWTLRPGGDNIRYKDAERIERQSFAIGSRAKGTLKFPMHLDIENPKSPIILAVNMDCDEATCLPMFVLQTETSLDDTAGLRRDCDSLTKNLDKFFDGVSNRNKTIAVQLVNVDYFDKSDPTDFRIMRVPTVADWRY